MIAVVESQLTYPYVIDSIEPLLRHTIQLANHRFVLMRVHLVKHVIFILFSRIVQRNSIKYTHLNCILVLDRTESLIHDLPLQIENQRHYVDF